VSEKKPSKKKTPNCGSVWSFMQATIVGNTMIIHTDVIKGYFAETNHVGGKKARETLKELRSNDEPLGSELEGGE
jgi:hypothetical protein